LPLLRGTLDLMILKALTLGPAHGFGVVRILDETTDGVFFVEEGSLYPSLHRLQKSGFVESEWGISEAGRRARFYALTNAGRERLEQETADWELLRRSVERVLELGPA